MVDYVLDDSNISFKVSAETLDAGDLILHTFSGVEELSKPFEFKAIFRSSKSDLDLTDLIGKSVTVSASFGKVTRHFNGIFWDLSQGVSEINEEGAVLTFYHASIYPKLWHAKLSSNCKIFQQKTALAIIKSVLQSNGVTLKDKTQGAGSSQRDFCVQYNETDFDFVSRLMEEEGIFYFFAHTKGMHTMILGDDSSVHTPISSFQTTPYDKRNQENVPLGVVVEAQYKAQLVLSDFRHVDYDFTKPSTQLNSVAKGSDPAIFGKAYEYPGKFTESDDGDDLANIRLQAAEALKVTLNGLSTAPTFSPGYTFTLKGHPRDDLNAGYILHRVDHHLQLIPDDKMFSYKNTYQAFPDDVTFRAPCKTPRPKIAGTQTARVTGKSGEEIWTDEYGRIKVKFHWDIDGTSDDKSSCWVRVAQGWAGGGWGILFTPRIGMEVVVSFLCGDPDQPLVTGAVYNGDNMPPYLPDEPTKSTIFSNTTKGGSGFNEIRLEDKKGEEEVWVHAQKDMNVDIIQDLSTIVEKGDELRDIQKGSRTTHIKHDDAKTLDDGDSTLLIKKGNLETTLKDGDETNLVKKGDYTRKVKGDYTLEVGGDMTIKVKGNLNIKVTQDYTLKAQNITEKAQSEALFGAGTAMTHKAGTEMTQKAGTEFTQKAGMNFNQKAAMNMIVKAGMLINLKSDLNIMMKAGVGFMVDSGATVLVKGGAAVAIKAGAAGIVEASAVQAVKGAALKLN